MTEVVIPDLIGNLKSKKVQNFFKKVLHFYFLCLYLQSQMKGNTNRGVAQLASASGLGPEGPVFESQYPDKAEAEMLPLFLCFGGWFVYL